jgi:hypothetical protein
MPASSDPKLPSRDHGAATNRSGVRRSSSYVALEPQIVGWRDATASLSGAIELRPGRLRRRGSAEPLPPWSIECRCVGPRTQPAHNNGLQWYPNFNSRASSQDESFHNIDQAIPACFFR